MVENTQLGVSIPEDTSPAETTVTPQMGNCNSPTVIAAAIISRQGKKPLPTHIKLEDSPKGLEQEPFITSV